MGAEAIFDKQLRTPLYTLRTGLTYSLPGSFVASCLLSVSWCLRRAVSPWLLDAQRGALAQEHPLLRASTHVGQRLHADHGHSLLAPPPSQSRRSAPPLYAYAHVHPRTAARGDHPNWVPTRVGKCCGRGEGRQRRSVVPEMAVLAWWLVRTSAHSGAYWVQNSGSRSNVSRWAVTSLFNLSFCLRFPCAEQKPLRMAKRRPCTSRTRSSSPLPTSTARARARPRWT